MQINIIAAISGVSIPTLLEWKKVFPFAYDAVKEKCIKELKESENKQKESNSKDVAVKKAVVAIVITLSIGIMLFL